MGKTWGWPAETGNCLIPHSPLGMHWSASDRSVYANSTWLQEARTYGTPILRVFKTPLFLGLAGLAMNLDSQGFRQDIYAEYEGFSGNQ